MPAFHLDQLKVPRRPAHPANSRLWREWCFVRAVWLHFRVRLLVLAGLLALGGAAFKLFEPEKQHTLGAAVYMVWSLIFNQTPEAFPRHPVLQFLFFAVPVLGLVMIIEGIVDFSLLVRDRRRAERSWCRMMAGSMSGHIVLVGVGRLGYRMFRLLRKLGEPVVVIERDANNEFLDTVRREEMPLLIGDARRGATLVEANIAAAKSIILATDDDLANLEIALDARRVAPKICVVMRMFDQNMADKVREGFNIHLAMSQAALAAPTFAMAAIDRSIVNSQVIGDKLVVMQRWTIRHDGPLCNRTVGDVLRDYGFSVVERRRPRAEPELFPPPETRLAQGEELLVQGPFEMLLKLQERSAAVQ